MHYPFVQIHTLRSYPVSLPNRGAEGLAKRAVYGGIERQRISSQCIKHALRKAQPLVRVGSAGALVPDTLKDLAASLGLGLSVRSAMIGSKRLLPMLKEAGIADAEAWTQAVMGLWRREREQPAQGAQEAEPRAGRRARAAPEPEDAAGMPEDTPLVVGTQELALLTVIVKVLAAQGIAPAALRRLFERDTELRRAPSEVQDALHALRTVKRHAGIDGALFGRMATGVAVSNVDAAVYVGHAITVHPIASIADFFSVTDDEKDRESGDRGGSHINTAELTTGVFYHHTVVSISQAMANLSCTDAEAAEVTAWLVRALATVEPAAKLGPTAPFAGLVEAMVEVGSRQPRTLAGAFEVPVEPEHGKGLSTVAHERLAAFAAEMDSLCGAPEHRLWLRDRMASVLPAVEALAEQVKAKLISG